MAAAGIVKMENHLEKFFKPEMATPGEYDFEVLPRQTKTRRQLIVYRQAEYRNLCRKVRVDTESSFNMMFTDLKSVMKSAAPTQWDDLKERTMTANELFWRISAELRIPSKATEAAEFMRMSKLINTVAGYLEDLQIKFGTEENPNSADDTFRNLKLLMQAGVTQLPHREVIKIIENLFDMLKHTNEPFLMKHTVDDQGRAALVIAPKLSRKDIINKCIRDANTAMVQQLQVEPERLKSVTELINDSCNSRLSRREQVIRILDEINEPVDKLNMDNISKLMEDLKPFKETRLVEMTRTLFGKSESASSHLQRYARFTDFAPRYEDDYFDFDFVNPEN